ncbi:MAG: TIGR02996 domain-containing protein, partial [Deltaproteobacteria bacterium]|nr:TIGR02996 domain-containing protein [Deltaproteobacteria bacterium]
MSDADTELAAALAALASDDDEQALERLVTSWSLCRAAPLIALVDTLASRIEPRQKALGGKTADDRYEAFRTTAVTLRQADLARLIALLPRLAYGDVTAALDILLYQWRPTPRMRALLETVRLPGYTDRLEELRTAHATPRDEQLSARARATIAELHRLLTTTDDAGADLLAQVYADPAADAPRLVYADWATSRGDPRGELITLQFTRRDRTPEAAAVRRERELLEQYMQRWLAPIWHAIRPYSVRFDRGFLASVTVEPFAVITPRPEWSTVQSLELAYHEELPMQAFPALRELRNVTPKLLSQIASEPRALTHIGLAIEPGPADAVRVALRTPRSMPVIAELARGEAFPALCSLGVWGYPEDWAWIWETQLARQLTRIEVTHGFADASPWLDDALPASVREVRIRERANEARFLRDGSAFPRVEVICREPSKDVLAWT